MTSPLPPRRRDSRNLADLIRQDRQNLKQVWVGGGGGRVPQARPLSRNVTDGNEDDDELELIEFLNTDTFTASGPGTFTGTLTFEPETGSEHVYWNGLAQPPTEWSRDGTTLTVKDPSGHLRAGDKIDVAYAYYDQTPDAPDLLVVGATIATGPITSIAVPAGVVAGDLLLLVSAAFGPVTTSDSRIVGTHQAFGTGELVAWGYADGSGTAVAVSVDGGTFGYASTSLVAYRGVRVIPPVAQNTSTGSTLTAATFPNANAALCAAVSYNGTATGTLSPDTTGDWITDSSEFHVKTNVRVSHWVSADPATTPLGLFTLGGDNAGFGAVTLLLGGVG